MQQKNILFIMLFIFTISFESCIRDEDNVDKQNINNVINDTIRTYYKDGQLKEEFLIDKSNLKQGEYKLFYENGMLMELCHFYNDTIIGFRKFYNKNEQIIEMKSQFYISQDKLGIGERIVFKYDSLNNQSGMALTFASTIEEKDNGVLINFDPYFEYDYDSISVDIIYRGCNLVDVNKCFDYGPFQLRVNTTNLCNDVLIKFKFSKIEKSGDKISRNIQRIYPIFDGKLVSDQWVNN